MIAGETSLSAPETVVRRKKSKTADGARFFRTKVETESEERGRWKYPAVKGDKAGSWAAFGVAVAAHAIFFFGFGKTKPAPVVAAQTQVTEVALFQAPVVEEELMAESPADSANVEESSGVDVPVLPDVPAVVNLGDFVQAVQLGNMLPRADLNSLKNLATIPGNFRAGGQGGEGNGLGNIFSLSDLDRSPAPTYRPSPTIPRHLLTVATGVNVTVEFVVSTKGDVLNPRVVSSDNQNFNDVALNTVKRWKFKPGFRQGRTVNVSMSQSIDFKVSGS